MELHSDCPASSRSYQSIPEICQAKTMVLCNRSNKSKTKRYKKKKGRKNRRRELIWLRLQQALEESAKQEVKRRPTLKISRTVEMVDQSNADWREDRSKLLYMIGIGLTPILGSNAVPLPSIILSKRLPKPDDDHGTSNEEEDSNEVKEYNRKKALRQERVQRFEKLRAWRANYFDLRTEIIEVIDLTSDNESIEEIQAVSPLTVPTPSVPLIETGLSRVIKSHHISYRERLPLKQVNHKRRSSAGYTRRKRKTKHHTISNIKESHNYGNGLFISYVNETGEERSDGLIK